MEWISVKDRFPENYSRVLVYIEGKPFEMDCDRLVNSRWVRWNGYVTHWMPLPEPPKGVAKSGKVL